MLTLIKPEQMRATLVAGFGCQRGCPADVMLELIESSLRVHGLELQDLCALASIDLKNNEPGLLELARRLASARLQVLDGLRAAAQRLAP